MLYKTASVADFIMSDEHLQLLSSVNKLVFDDHSKVRPLNVLLECFVLLWNSMLYTALHKLWWQIWWFMTNPPTFCSFCLS